MRSKRALALVIGAAAAGAVVAKQARRTTPRSDRRTDRPADGPTHQSRAARTREVARMGTKAGGSYALHRARRVFADAERQKHLDHQFELRTAEHIAESLGNMKGAMMKLGQMVSYLDAGLPPHVRDALAQLRSDAPPMSAELAAGVITEELGAPPEELFLEWDPVPIASASIGQVHRAITHQDLAVAVKVQYPGIDKAIEADLANADLLFGGLGMLFPGLEPGPLVEEIRSRILEELDYRLEAANQQLFADRYREHPFIHIPEVVPELSSKRVLTTELAEGVRFEELQDWPQAERDLAAETMFRFVFRSLYGLHAFNGDPHPGNYLFRPGGHVVFLDFGLVKHFTDADMAMFADMVRTQVFERDPARYRHTLEQIGLLKPGAAVSDELVADYSRHFYEWVIEDRVATMDPDYASESVRRYFDANGPYGEVIKASNVPPAFVIIQRINLGLYAILGDLHATANWRRISEEIWPWADGAPSTPIGEAEATWLATHR